MLVEEAGQVLEAHVLGNLVKGGFKHILYESSSNELMNRCRAFDPDRRSSSASAYNSELW
jgi:hypothetical protein